MPSLDAGPKFASLSFCNLAKHANNIKGKIRSKIARRRFTSDGWLRLHRWNHHFPLNVEVWHQLAGAPLRVTLRLTATLRLIHWAGSRVLNAGLCGICSLGTLIAIARQNDPVIPECLPHRITKPAKATQRRRNPVQSKHTVPAVVSSQPLATTTTSEIAMHSNTEQEAIPK